METPRTRMSINGMIWDRVPKGVFVSGDILDLESVMPWHISILRASQLWMFWQTWTMTLDLTYPNIQAVFLKLRKQLNLKHFKQDISPDFNQMFWNFQGYQWSTRNSPQTMQISPFKGYPLISTKRPNNTFRNSLAKGSFESHNPHSLR